MYWKDSVLDLRSNFDVEMFFRAGRVMKSLKSMGRMTLNDGAGVDPHASFFWKAFFGR